MTFAVVQQLGLQLIDGVSGASTFNMVSNFGAGNQCVIPLACFSASVSTVVVNGTSATRVSRSTDTSGTTVHAELWYVDSLPGGTKTVVVTPTGAGQFLSLGAVEVSGLAASAFDVQAVNTPTNTAAPTVVSPSPLAQTSEVAFAAFGSQTGNLITISSPVGWTSAFSSPDGANHQAGAGAFIDLTSRGTTAAVTAVFGAVDTDTSQQTSAAIATFKISTGTSVDNTGINNNRRLLRGDLPHLRMSPRSEHEAQQFLRNQKRAFSFAA